MDTTLARVVLAESIVVLASVESGAGSVLETPGTCSVVVLPAGVVESVAGLVLETPDPTVVELPFAVTSAVEGELVDIEMSVVSVAFVDGGCVVFVVLSVLDVAIVVIFKVLDVIVVDVLVVDVVCCAATVAFFVVVVIVVVVTVVLVEVVVLVEDVVDVVVVVVVVVLVEVVVFVKVVDVVVVEVVLVDVVVFVVVMFAEMSDCCSRLWGAAFWAYTPPTGRAIPNVVVSL